MCLSAYSVKSYTEEQKLKILMDFLVFLQTWECDWDYDFFRSLCLQKKQLAMFLKNTVPFVYDNLDYKYILWDLLELVQNDCEKTAYEYPTYYMMCVLTGAIYLHARQENLSLKKMLARWSQILLNIL